MTKSKFQINFKIQIPIVAILFFAPLFVFAGTTGLSKSSFEISGAPMSVSSNELWVSNVDTMPQKYELKLDSDLLRDNISFSPREFSVDPGESQKIVVRFRQMENSSKTYLSLLSFDSNQPNKLKVGTGIKIPVLFEPTQGSPVFSTGQYGAINLQAGFVWIINIILLIFLGFKIRERVLRSRHVLSNKNFFYE